MSGDEEPRRGSARLLVMLATIIVFPLLVILAFYASLNVTATNGSFLGNFSLPVGFYYSARYNGTQTSFYPLNETSPPNGSSPNFFPNVSLPPSLLISIIIAILIFVTLSVVFNFRRQKVSGATKFDEELEKQRKEVADVLDRTASELRQGGEYRRSVLECYRRICEILESKSKIDGKPLTAREFESTVSSRLRFESPFLSQITGVFEVARYSDHEISRREADIAIDCLTNLSSVLREMSSGDFN